MYFQHSDQIWQDHPELVPGVLYAEGITVAASVESQVRTFNAIARSRLAGSTESEFPEIQAWRRTFSRMGLKPTQYRCAAESLLRRFRKEQQLPRIHPLIDLCNSLSLAFAIPIAVFDVDAVTEHIEVRRARGDEIYVTLGGDTERPDPDEVIFADADNHAHARRWTNRQSGRSAVRAATSTVLVVAEGMHAKAAEDVATLTAAIADELTAVWSAAPKATILTRRAPRFDF
jgi:DNA/RNA-binding domain of Phe-tRNA-synthetase-like protein